ncbi:UNVERIFIED_CONTAM: hypothetical protein Cloal_0689 [Acetivibrio alkalicellulosi]
MCIIDRLKSKNPFFYIIDDIVYVIGKNVVTVIDLIRLNRYEEMLIYYQENLNNIKNNE